MTTEQLRILIVDDEEIARERIARFLNELVTADSPITSRPLFIEQAENGLEALERITAVRPHIVFLDVQMPGLNGFDVLAQIPERGFHIVFQTAYDSFALRAFEESAIDYLLKPFPRERFALAFGKALQAMSQAEALSKLETALRKSERYLETISYKHGGRVRLLKSAEITHFLSRDHCTSAFTKDGEHLIDLSLNDLEKSLNPTRFIRCHRNTIVALEQVRTITSSTEPELELLDGTRVALSRSNRRKVLDRLK